MRISTIILSLSLISILSMGAITTYNFYAPITSGTENDILISKGENNNPVWVSRKSTPATMAASMGGTITCYRLGQIVFLLFNAVNKYSDNVQQVATIPVGYRPINWMCAAAPDAQNLCGMWNIGTTGVIELYGPYSYTSGGTTSRKNYFGTIMYFTNDAMP